MASNSIKSSSALVVYTPPMSFSNRAKAYLDRVHEFFMKSSMGRLPPFPSSIIFVTLRK